MKHIAIGKIFTSFFTTTEEMDGDGYDKRLGSFYTEFRALCKKHNIDFADSYMSLLGMEKYAIHSCDSCNKLMLNRDKNPTGFGEEAHNSELNWVVMDGGEHEGKLLCEDCLPSTHRWGQS